MHHEIPGIKYGERAVKELEGPSPVDLQTFLDGRETHVIYDSFTEGVIIYCYMENYYPSGLGEVAVPKSLQDPDRYVYKAYEEGDKYVVEWTYTFTDADYEAARARGPVRIGIV